MPNRVIKDSIRTSKSVNSLSDFQFRTWAYLITYVDDFGRGSADSELLKGFVFPRRKGVTEQQISKVLADLATIGMITLYEVDGESFFCFPNWDKHQRIQTKRSKFPAPPESTVNHRDSPPESNPNPNPNPNPTTNPTRARGASAVATYLDRVNPSASQKSLELLSAYERDMGAEVCLRAIDIALDNRKATWAYIRAILQRWSSEGVRCLADIDALEARHEAQKQSGVKTRPGAGGTAPQPAAPGESDRRAREDMERLRKMMRGGKMET